AMGAATDGTRPAVIGAGAFQLDMFADDAHEVGGLTNLFDDVVGNHEAVRRLGGWALGSTNSNKSGAITSLIAPTSTTTRPSERISRTTPTFPCPVLTRSPPLRFCEPPNRPTSEPHVLSVASSPIPP